MNMLNDNDNLSEVSSQSQEFLTKFLPGNFDLYQKNSESVSDFSEFISKGFHSGLNSVFSVKSVDDFFFNVPDYYNPFRSLATVVKTSSDSIEIPSFGSVGHAWGATSSQDVPAKDSSLVRLWPLHAKVELPASFLRKARSAESFIKSILARSVSKLERSAFIYGDGNGKPFGILSSTAPASLKINIAAVDAASVDDFRKILPDQLLNLSFSVPNEFRINSVFLMNSKMQAFLLGLKNAQGDYIFSNGSLFGYKVVTIDELKFNEVVFGNLQYGFVIADSISSEIKTHDLFEKPNFVGLSMPYYCGASLVLPEALAALRFNLSPELAKSLGLDASSIASAAVASK